MTNIPLTGPEAIAHALGRLDLQKLEEEQREVIRQKKKTARPRAVRVLRILQGMKRNKIQPLDLLTDTVPVIPPAFRPFSVTGNTFLPGDSNELYRDLVEYRGLYQNTLKTLGPEAANSVYEPMSQAVRALYGYGDSPNPKIKSRSVKGFFDVVTGSSPKQSFYQSKMLAKPVDAVARGVIVPDADLDMNEVGLPVESAWSMYGSHIQRQLVLGGQSPAGALRALRDRTPQAQNALDKAMIEKPVVVSRAPAWHKFNVVGQRPRLVEGDAIRINTFISEGLGADYDGDTVSVHLPSTPEAIKEVREKLMPDKMVWSVKDRGQVMAAPKHEQILGLNLQGGKRIAFRNRAEVIKALDAGEISPADEVDITP